MEVYERIKARRKELELSADDVANALNVSRATIYRYESAEIEKLPITVLEPLSKILRCSPGYLMGWEDRIEGNPIKAVTEDAEMLMDSECRELCSYFKKLNNANRKIVINLAKSLSEAAT